MICSETIGEVSSALVKARSEFTAVSKDSENPYFNSKYSDINSILGMIDPILSNHGLSIIQPSIPSGDGVCIQTVLLHESGEYLASEGMLVPAAKNDPQGYGAAVTYTCRYALQSFFGLRSEDDDGNAAVQAMSKVEQARARAAQRSS